MKKLLGLVVLALFAGTMVVAGIGCGGDTKTTKASTTKETKADKTGETKSEEKKEEKK